VSTSDDPDFTSDPGKSAPVIVGDDALFEVYRQLHPKLMRYLRVVLPCPADADALAAGKVWPAMFDKLTSEPVTSPHALLVTIARCRVSNWYRDHRREREELTGKAEDIATALRPTELPEGLISNEGLAAAVRELPQRQREAVFLRFLAGLDTDAIALYMGIGTRRVNQLLAVALTALRTSPHARHYSPATVESRTEAQS
jgi:RNA polymerase sigma factor (sigma-70 family)